MSVLVAAALLQTAALLAPPPQPLAQTCGWPSVHAGGLFGAPTVRLAQRLLGFALHEPPSVAPPDGPYDC
jgi:hypothetical protein